MKAKLLMRDEQGHPIEVLNAHQCDAKDHEPRLATWRVFWVDGPHEYCNECAQRLSRIGEVMGYYVHREKLPLPEPKEKRRAFDFDFSKEAV